MKKTMLLLGTIALLMVSSISFGANAGANVKENIKYIIDLGRADRAPSQEVIYHAYDSQQLEHAKKTGEVKHDKTKSFSMPKKPHSVQITEFKPGIGDQGIFCIIVTFIYDDTKNIKAISSNEKRCEVSVDQNEVSINIPYVLNFPKWKTQE